MEAAFHRPVLLKETVDALLVREGGRYVDGTLGRAGHAREIVARGGSVLGIDRDGQALEEVEKAVASEGMPAGRLRLARGNHGELERIANENGWRKVDGVLLDLGVSSPQLDEGERGFSFLRDGPLDMRMDRSQDLAAADLVNIESEGRLAEIFRELGEEPRAGRLAREICAARRREKFVSTVQFARFVEKVLGRNGPHHPATRAFQALRMAVNDETGELERALDGGLAILAENGRFAVITFESITDRIVKRKFAAHAGKMESLQQGGEEWRGTRPRVRLVWKKPVVPGKQEVSENPRARSAKLRVAEKTEE